MTKYYLQTNILCIFIVLIIYLSLKKRNDAVPARRRIFNQLLLIIALICVADIFAWYFNGLNIPGAKGILQGSNIIYDAAITWAGFAWLNYVNLRVRSVDYEYEKSKRILAIPLIIMILLLVSNPLTGWIFTIDETNTYARANGIVVPWIISFCMRLLSFARLSGRLHQGRRRNSMYLCCGSSFHRSWQLLFRCSFTEQRRLSAEWHWQL